MKTDKRFETAVGALGARDAAREIHRATKPSKHEKDRARRVMVAYRETPVSGNKGKRS